MAGKKNKLLVLYDNDVYKSSAPPRVVERRDTRRRQRAIYVMKEADEAADEIGREHVVRLAALWAGRSVTGECEANVRFLCFFPSSPL